MLSISEIESFCFKVPGKWVGEQDIVTTLLPTQHINRAFCDKNVHGWKEIYSLCCSQSLVSKLGAHAKSKQEGNILTADVQFHKSQGISTIQLKVDNVNPINSKVLVGNSNLLEWTLLKSWMESI